VAILSEDGHDYIMAVLSEIFHTHISCLLCVRFAMLISVDILSQICRGFPQFLKAGTAEPHSTLYIIPETN
jgi:hypothetical protein